MLQTLFTLGATGGQAFLLGTALAAQPTPPAPPAPPAPAVERGPGHDREHDRDDHRDDRRGKWIVVEGDRAVQTFKVGEAGSLRISNLAGDVVVSGDKGSEIRVSAVKHGKGRSDGDARQELGKVEVQMQKVGERVEIETTHQRNSRAWVDYTITVPAGTTVDAKTVSGDIKISSVQGAVRAESVSGDVVATSLARVASLKSVSGDILASSIGSEAEFSMASVSGNVTAKGVKGRSAGAETVSGDIALSGCACGQASAQSVSGSIDYAGTLSKSGRYDFTTHSGDVTLATGDAGFELEASTFSGSLQNDLPMTTRSGDMEGRRGPGRWIKAVVGNGGAYVQIKTFSGDIRLTKTP